LQGTDEIGAQEAEIALDSFGPANHDVIGASFAVRRNELASEGAETPLHPVADDGAADLLGDGETDSLGGVAVLAVSDEQDESRGCRAPAGVRSEEIRAFGDRD